MEKKDAITIIEKKADEIRERQDGKKKNIEDNYKKELDNLRNENIKLVSLIENNYKLIEQYSHFIDVYDIMTVLADVTSLFMGTEYLYEQKSSNPVLVPVYDKNLEVISFFDEFYYEMGLIFYKYEEVECDNWLQYKFKVSETLEKYDFLKGFIDYVISYKFSTSSNYVSYRVLKRLEKEFVLANISEIRKINAKRNKLEKKLYEENVKKREKRISYFTRDLKKK